jgi:hypothetical protein
LAKHKWAYALAPFGQALAFCDIVTDISNVSLLCGVRYKGDLVITLLYDIFLHDDKVGALRHCRTSKYTYALAWLYMA